jgi:hypothetical protein
MTNPPPPSPATTPGGTEFSIWSKSKRRWYRGAKLWRWTRFYRFAARHDHPLIMRNFVVPELQREGHVVALIRGYGPHPIIENVDFFRPTQEQK